MIVSRWNLKVNHDIAKHLPKIFISYCGGFTVMSSNLLLCPHGRTETALLERQCKWDQQVWKVMECNRCPLSGASQPFLHSVKHANEAISDSWHQPIYQMGASWGTELFSTETCLNSWLTKLWGTKKWFLF